MLIVAVGIRFSNDDIKNVIVGIYERTVLHIAGLAPKTKKLKA
jgi:hypothetical protein